MENNNLLFHSKQKISPKVSDLTTHNASQQASQGYNKFTASSASSSVQSKGAAASMFQKSNKNGNACIKM